MTSFNFFGLTPSQYRTLILVFMYLENRGRLCLTYRGLRAWVYYNNDVRGWQEWHTIERNLRKLVEVGVLRRITRGRSVLFCKGGKYYLYLLEYRRVAGSGGDTRNKELKKLIDYLTSP